MVEGLALSELIEYSGDIEKDITDNPLLVYKHLPGDHGQVPGAQEQFHFCNAKIKILCGGNRSGKSSEGAEYMITKALITPNGRGWAACPSAELSVEIQQRKIWQYLPKNEIEYGFYDKVNGFRHNKVILKNGFQLIFKTYEQGVEKFQSDDIDILWFDEEPPYEIYQQGLMRTADRAGEVYATLTPLNGFTKFVDEILLKKKSNITGNSIRVFHLSTLDNIHISQEQVEMITDGMSNEEKKTLLHGVPMNKEGLVYEMWKDQFPYVVTLEQWNKVKDRTTRFTSIDPHNRTPTAVGFYGVDRDGRFWLYDEIFEHLLVNELCQKIKEKEGTCKPEWRVIDNSAQAGNLLDGKSLRMQLMENGIDTMLCKKDDKNTASISLMRQMLSDKKDGLPMFVVVENCTRARYEFGRYSWGSYASEKTENEKGMKQDVRKKDDHIMDANHYIIRSQAFFFGDDRSTRNGNNEIIIDPVLLADKPDSQFVRTSWKSYSVA